MTNAEEFVAIRRKKDGLYYPRWTTHPQFMPPLRARTVVRVDLGQDLTDYDFPTKNDVRNWKQLKW